LLRSLAEGSESWAIAWPSVYEFFSVVTNSRIWKQAASSPDQAWAQLAAWFAAPGLSVLSETGGFAAVLAGLARRALGRGPEGDLAGAGRAGSAGRPRRAAGGRGRRLVERRRGDARAVGAEHGKPDLVGVAAQDDGHPGAIPFQIRAVRSRDAVTTRVPSG